MQTLFVDNSNELNKLLNHLASTKTIAFDTEFVSESSYKPDLCLIQVATRDMVGVVDPKAVPDLTDFWACLVNPDVEVIVHAAREEFRFCKRESGARPGNLFDVQVAAGMVGIEYPAAYSTLIQKILKQTLAKGETRTDWRKRPLTAKQIEYAQKDVYYLHGLYDWMKNQLEAAGRMDWFLDEMASQQNRFEEEHSEFAWTRISGLNSLRGTELSVAKELFYWREREAERRNCPVRRVLRDDLITELSRRKSAEISRIRSIRGMERRDISQHIDSISQVIKEAIDLPKPKMPPAPSRQQNQQLNMIGQFMNAVLAGICKQCDLAPAIVGNASDVKEFIAYELKLTQARKKPGLTVGWRDDVIGNQLRDVLHGKSLIRIQDPLGSNPVEFLKE
ncbi:MAG: HRDC domain-containing protein [Planctomycetota bacterium]|nr:HRDC domain-containing protein [Planctomycetota bacterium]